MDSSYLCAPPSLSDGERNSVTLSHAVAQQGNTMGDAARGAARGAIIGGIAGDAGKGAAAGAIGGALFGGMRRARR